MSEIKNLFKIVVDGEETPIRIEQDDKAINRMKSYLKRKEKTLKNYHENKKKIKCECGSMIYDLNMSQHKAHPIHWKNLELKKRFDEKYKQIYIKDEANINTN